MKKEHSKGIELIKKLNIYLVFIILLVVVVSIVGLLLYEVISPLISPGNIAVVPIEGILSANGNPASGYANANLIASEIKSADANPNIKAIVLEIDSPGGDVVAVNIITAALKNNNKPVVAWIQTLGASGAYWVASYANKIVADNYSTVGSIGVTSSYLDYANYLKSKNITYYQIVAGSQKEIGSPYVNLTQAEFQRLQNMTNLVYSEFVSEVAANRNLSTSFVRGTNATIFLGYQAKSLGLVDYIGDAPTVRSLLENITGLSSLSFVNYDQFGEGFYSLSSQYSNSELQYAGIYALLSPNNMNFSV